MWAFTVVCMAAFHALWVTVICMWVLPSQSSSPENEEYTAKGKNSDVPSMASWVNDINKLNEKITSLVPSSSKVRHVRRGTESIAPIHPQTGGPSVPTENTILDKSEKLEGFEQFLRQLLSGGVYGRNPWPGDNSSFSEVRTRHKRMSDSGSPKNKVSSGNRATNVSQRNVNTTTGDTNVIVSRVNETSNPTNVTGKKTITIISAANDVGNVTNRTTSAADVTDGITGAPNDGSNSTNTIISTANVTDSATGTITGDTKVTHNGANATNGDTNVTYNGGNVTTADTNVTHNGANATDGDTNVTDNGANATTGDANVTYSSVNATISGTNVTYNDVNTTTGGANITYNSVNATNSGTSVTYNDVNTNVSVSSANRVKNATNVNRRRISVASDVNKSVLARLFRLRRSVDNTTGFTLTNTTGNGTADNSSVVQSLSDLCPSEFSVPITTPLLEPNSTLLGADRNITDPNVTDSTGATPSTDTDTDPVTPDAGTAPQTTPELFSPVLWPTGEYSLPVPFGDCPDSDNFTREADFLDDPMLRPFQALNLTLCDRNVDGVSESRLVSWMAGQYCVFAANATAPCPQILNHENINLTQVNGTSLALPYCCVNDPRAEPLTVPSTKPFYLLPVLNQSCTRINGMTSTVETMAISLHSVTSVTSSENAPTYKWSIYTKTLTFSFCHYKPPTISPGNRKKVLIPPNTTSPSNSSTNSSAQAETQPDPIDPMLLVAILVPVGAVLLIATVVIVVVVVVRGRRRKRAKNVPDVSVIDVPSLQDPTSLKVEKPAKVEKPLELGRVLTMILDPETQLTIYGLLIHPDKLVMEDKIGTGAFGTVYYGRYKPDDNPLHAKEVAIKTLKDNCGYADINGFMNEALVMADFNHPNVLGLTGVCIQEESHVPIIVLPYMEHGDLKNYLRHFRYDQDKMDKAPDFPQLLCFCLHIARGMNYLAQMKFVHRDLAARNCMLDGNMVAKVADFGLTRDIYCSSYYRQDRNKLLPIKWMALESLQDRVFTTYSDVWAYGITVWEILTLGKVPYPDLENYQVIGFLENGGRLSKPEVATDGLYQLLQNCWDETAKSRPSFADIAKELGDTLTGLCGYMDLGEDVVPEPVTPIPRNPVRTTYSTGSDAKICSSAEPMIPREPVNIYSDYREIGKK